MLSFDSVECECDNCEGPVVDYCCPTGFNGQCCEYPLKRSAKSGGHLTPLEKKLKQLEEEQPSLRNTKTPPVRPPVIPNITVTEPED